MTQIWKPVVVTSVRDVVLEDEDVGLVCMLDDGREEVAWVAPDVVRSSEDLEVVTGWVWDWEAWSLADDLLGPYRTPTEEQATFTVDANRYFLWRVDNQGNPVRGRFLPEVLAADVERDTFLAVGPDERLWRYVNGVYVPDGEPFVRTEATRLIRGQYDPVYVNKVVAHFYDRTSGRRLPETPSTDVINVANGMLLWKTGVGEVHDPEKGSLVQLPVRFDPGAECTVIDAFLRESVPEDAVEFVYELVGYFMVPGNPFRKAVLLLGPTASGKSTFLGLLRAFLGTRNCSAASLADLGANRFTPAQLFGKLANVCGDIGTRANESSEMFKKITGGDPIQAEHKNHHPFVYRPFTKLIFSANEPPRGGDFTSAYFTRWLVIPFEHEVAPHEQDPLLGAKLAEGTELSGLLNAALAGLRRLQTRGLVVPESVTRAVLGYRAEVDHVVQYVDQCVTMTDDPLHGPARNVVYTHYSGWCQRTGQRPVTPQVFYRRLLEATGASMPSRRVLGIALTEEAGSEV